MKNNFRTYNLAVEFYQLVRLLALTGDARSQLDRASRSVALNLAEGSGRIGKDRKRFYRIAFASLRESQSVLDLELVKDQNILLLADKLAAHIYRLMGKS